MLQIAILHSFFMTKYYSNMNLLRWCSGKESACQCRRWKRQGFNLWVRKILWNRKWQPALVFLPGKFHGQKCLVGYSPCCLVAQSCPTLCSPMDCSLPGFPVHGILQARILEWLAISYSRGSSQPRDRTHVSCVSCIVGRFFTH